MTTSGESTEARRRAWNAAWRQVGWRDWAGRASAIHEPTATVLVMRQTTPGWEFYVTFTATGDVIGLRVERSVNKRVTAKAPALSARWWRDLPVSEVIAAAELELQNGVVPEDVDKWTRAMTVHRPGRAGRDDFEYAKVAALYVEKVRDRMPAPTARLANDLDLTERQVRNLLSQARKRNLLSQPSQGCAGGDLTRKAIDALTPKDVMTGESDGEH